MNESQVHRLKLNLLENQNQLYIKQDMYKVERSSLTILQIRPMKNLEASAKKKNNNNKELYSQSGKVGKVNFSAMILLKMCLHVIVVKDDILFSVLLKHVSYYRETIIFWTNESHAI